MNLLVTFIVLNVANVIIQTVKSICTIKCGKTAAALVNAVAYGVYTIVLIYMNVDLDLWAKVIIVAAANLIGVYVVKWLEEKKRKDMLWKVEMIVPSGFAQELHELLNYFCISHRYFDTYGAGTVFNCYSETQAQSLVIKDICKKYNVKYFVSETKIL